MLFKHFVGVIYFKAVGDNPLRFLNKVRDSEFISKNLYCKNNEVYGKIYGNNYNRLVKIAKDNYMEICIVKKQGIIYRILPYKKRFGIGIGAIFSIAIIFFLSNTTLKIRISGCDKALSQNVLSVLEISGVEPGKFIPSMDFDQVERNIIATLKDVSWVSIRNSGGTVTINVSQSTEMPNMIPQRLPCNIISTKDAQIMNVQVYAGQLIVLIGNGVKKGDLLVSGFVVDKNSKATYYHAQAKVIGQYSEKIDFSQPLKEAVKIPSNEFKKRNYFKFFSVKLPLYIGKQVSGEFSYKERTNYFSLFSLKLPLGISHCEYESFEIKEFNYSVEEAKLKLNEKANIYEINFLKDCKILNKEITETVTEDTVNYSIKYLVQGDITQTNEILVKK